MSFRGRVRVPNAALQSRSQRERKVGIYISEELLRLVLARAMGREWRPAGDMPPGRYELHLHDAIRLALHEWVHDERTTSVTRVEGLASARPVESYSSTPTYPQQVNAARRRRQRQKLMDVSVTTGGLFYDFRNSEE